MITIYDKSATSFHTDGLGVLVDFVHAPEVTERHGYLECKFTYLLAGQHAKYVAQGYHVKMAPNDRQAPLPFTIYEAEPDYVAETIEVLARVKIANDIRNRSIPAMNFENAPLSSVLNQLKNSMRTVIDYRQTTDMTVDVSAEFEEMNAYEALISHEQSVLNRSGAQLIFYENGLSFQQVRGRKKVAVIRKESALLKKMAIRYNRDSLVTCIIPYTTLMNDSVVDGEHGKERKTTEQKVYGTPVISPNIQRYGLPEVTRYVEYRNESVSKREEQGDKDRKIELNNYKYQTTADLDQAASRFFVENAGIDSEKIVADLEMYGFYDAELTNFGLYDTIEFYSAKYDVDIELKVAETVYQPLTKRVIKVVFEQDVLTLKQAQNALNDGKVSGSRLSERTQQENTKYNQRNQMLNFIDKLDGTRLNFVSELPNPEDSSEGDVVFLDTGDKGEIWEFKEGAWHRRLSGELDEEIKQRLSEIDTQVSEAKDDLFNKGEQILRIFHDLHVNKDLAQEGKNIAESAIRNAGEISAKLLETERNLALFKTETDEKITQELVKVESKIPKSIGGRNLYTGTQLFDGTWGNIGSWTKEVENYKDLTVYSRSQAYNGIHRNFNVKSGETYTFSAYAKLSEVGKLSFGTQQNGRDVTVPSYWVDDCGTEWQRVHFTFTATSDGVIAPRIASVKSGVKIYVCGLKLERGSVATDWTPAPEENVSLTQFNRLEETAEGVKRSISKVEQRFPKKQLPLVNTSFNNAVRYYIIQVHQVLTDYVGKEATITFDLMIEPDGTERQFLFYHYQHSGIGIKLDDTANPHKKINVTKEWQTFSFTGEVIRKPIPTNYSYGSMIIYDPTGDNKFSVRNIKIEVDDIVTSVEFNNVRETAQLYERIIGRTKADATTNISRMLMSSELFMSEITTGGRRNLYTGTKNFDGSDWGVPADWQIGLKWNESTTKYKGCKVLYTKDVHNGLWQNIEVKKGEKITLTAVVHSPQAMKVHVLGKWDNAPFPATSPKAGLDKLSEIHTIPAGAWTKVSTTFTVTSDGSMQPRLEKRASDNEPDKIIFITQLMVEKGEDPTKEWTESAEEHISSRIAQTTKLIELGLFGSEEALARIAIGQNGIYLKGDYINLDGNVNITQAFIRKLIIDKMEVNDIVAWMAKFGRIIAQNIDANHITVNRAEMIQAAFTALNSRAYIDGNRMRINNNDGSFVEMNNYPEIRSQSGDRNAVVLGNGRLQFFDRNGSRGYIGIDLHTNSNKLGVYLSQGIGDFGFYYPEVPSNSRYRPMRTRTVENGDWSRLVTDEAVHRLGRHHTTQQWIQVKNDIWQMNGITVDNPSLPHGTQLVVQQEYLPPTNTSNQFVYKRAWTVGRSTAGDMRVYVDVKSYFNEVATFEKGIQNRSDERIKHDIQDTQIVALDEILKLSFKEFKLNSDNTYIPLGLIAQESGILRVQDEVEAVNMTLLAHLSAKAIQELHTEMKELRKQNRRLLNRLEAMERGLQNINDV